MKKINVVGHMNPDTDSILSSIVAAHYFKNVLKMDAQPSRAGEPNNETKFILKKFGIAAPVKFRAKKNEAVALVDHNETGQFAEGLNMDQVEWVIDHHKIEIKTEHPIAIRVEPLGSTCSVLAKMYMESGKKIPANLAKLMLGGIMSDTLNLTGPTTTEGDKKLAQELNKAAKLKINDFAKEIFAAKSSLKGVSTETIVNGDRKLFETQGKKVSVAVWETTDPGSVKPYKNKIINFLKDKKIKERLDYIFFFVVDIIKQNSLLYVLGEAEKTLADKAFKIGLEVDKDEMLLTGVVSRKKQMIPPLMKTLEK